MPTASNEASGEFRVSGFRTTAWLVQRSAPVASVARTSKTSALGRNLQLKRFALQSFEQVSGVYFISRIQLTWLIGNVSWIQKTSNLASKNWNVVWRLSQCNLEELEGIRMCFLRKTPPSPVEATVWITATTGVEFCVMVRVNMQWSQQARLVKGKGHFLDTTLVS